MHRPRNSYPDSSTSTLLLEDPFSRQAVLIVTVLSFFQGAYLLYLLGMYLKRRGMAPCPGCELCAETGRVEGGPQQSDGRRAKAA